MRAIAARSFGFARAVETRVVRRCRSATSSSNVAQLAAELVVLQQLLDGVEPGRDRGAFGQRGEHAVVQQPGAHRRHGAVEHREQRAVALAVAQGARQFEAAPRHLVECQERVRAVRLQPADVGEARLQRLLQVDDQGAGGGQAGLLVVEAEAGQRADLEVRLERGKRGRRVEGPVRAGRAALGQVRAGGLRDQRRRRSRRRSPRPASVGPVRRPAVRRACRPPRTTPVERSTHARPKAVPFPGTTATRWFGARGSSRSSSVTVPGVTIRFTSRWMIFFFGSGSSICSQTATRCPARRMRPEVVFELDDRHAGHRDRPSRLVSVSPRTREPSSRRPRTARRSRRCGTARACPDAAPWRPGTAASSGSWLPSSKCPSCESATAQRKCIGFAARKRMNEADSAAGFDELETWNSRRGRRAVLATFAHADRVALAVVLDLGHEAAHEQQAAAAGAFDVLDRGRVGHVLGVEPRPLVGDADVEPFGGDAVDDDDPLVGVHLVAVLDGVDQGLFEGQLDREDVVLGVRGGLQRLLDQVLDARASARSLGIVTSTA